MKYFLLFLFLIPSLVFSQLEMRVNQQSGSSDLHQIDNLNQITFASATEQDLMYVKKTDGTTDVYKLSDINLILFDGITGIEDLIPHLFKLSNYPNPFEHRTIISYSIEKRANVELKLFDSFGNLINILVDNITDAGDYTIEWDGRNVEGNKVSSGNYFYQLVVDNQVMTRQMVVIR